MHKDKSPANRGFHINGILRGFLCVAAIALLSFLYPKQACAQAVVPVDTLETAHPIPVDSNAGPFAPHDTLNSLKDFDSTVVDTSARSTMRKTGKHSALKAGLFTAVLPGLGQAYNKRYWKIPIIYAGFGGLGYALYYTSTNFNGYRAAYRQQEADPPNPNASYNGITDPGTLKEERDYFKKYLDISAIGTGVWYLLSIVDAVVDAHLMSWNMKDDISLSWHPEMAPPAYGNNLACAGVTFVVSF
jgi:Family of unknown function (DUF5683)